MSDQQTDEDTKSPTIPSTMGEPANTRKWDPLAIAGFVLAFASGIVGLTVSLIALKRHNPSEQGQRLAIWGVTISLLHIALTLLICWGVYTGYISTNGTLSPTIGGTIN